MINAEESLQRIEAALTAVLMLLVEKAKQEDRPSANGSIEGLLYTAGFTAQKDIVAITKTPKSTVSARLKEEGLT